MSSNSLDCNSKSRNSYPWTNPQPALLSAGIEADVVVTSFRYDSCIDCYDHLRTFYELLQSKTAQNSNRKSKKFVPAVCVVWWGRCRDRHSVSIHTLSRRTVDHVWILYELLQNCPKTIVYLYCKSKTFLCIKTEDAQLLS